MGLEINRPLSVGGINSKYFYEPKYISFGSISADSFENTSTNRYTSENAIKKMIANNPKIKNMIKVTINNLQFE